MVKVDQEQLITNLVIAEDLIEKAKKYLSKGTIDINDYNDTLKHASKFVLDCTINELEALKIDNTQLVMASMLIDRANKDLEKVGVMNYKRMWESLKKIVQEETEMLREEKKTASSSLLVDDLEAQYNEADYLAGEMEAIESRELLLQTKEKGETEK